MNRTEFLRILLEKWFPSLLTAIVGGAFVAYLAPKMQTQFAYESALKKRQLEIWEAIGENFTNYIQSRSRLVSLRESERATIKSKQGVARDILKRKEFYVQERDKYANLLRRDLLLASYYFETPARAQINMFLEWHNQYATATIDDMPPDEEYVKWRERIIEVIRSSLG